MMNSVCIIILFVATLSITLGANCFGPSSQLLVYEFSAFPSPVQVGDTVYIRAKVQPDVEIVAATVQIRVYYSTDSNVDNLTPIINMNGLDFCMLSSSVNCPLLNQTYILAWEFVVPDILPGTYQVIYNILQTTTTADQNAYSCIQFEIDVAGTSASKLYTSWYQATLLGTALFSNPNYAQRSVGDQLQVGPSGPLNITSPPYGSIKGLSGSGDLVPPNYDTSGFVWGLSGQLTKSTIGPKGQISHTYEGQCYLGYISGAYNFDFSNALITGTFNLVWSYTDGSTAHIAGDATFSPDATIPDLWGYPLLYGRLQKHQVITSDVGFLLIKASLPYCADGVCKIGAPTPSDSGSSGLSSSKLGLAVGLPIAAVFVLVLVAAALLWAKRRRESEQEDGIFAVARKPEYGSALVVDDIIQETRGSKTLQAMLDVKYEDEASHDGSEDESGTSKSGESRSRSVSRSRSASGSRSRSRSRSSNARSRSIRGAESDAGESASRGGSDSE